MCQRARGIVCLAVAVTSIDAISVSVPMSRHSPELRDRVAAALLTAARQRWPDPAGRP